MAEFNTYDILKQRYLGAHPRGAGGLKEQVKHKPSARDRLLSRASRTRRHGAPHGELTMVTLRRPPN